MTGREVCIIAVPPCEGAWLLARRLHRQRQLIGAGARRRQREAHGGPLALDAVDRQLPAVREHEVPDDGEAEPGAAQVARARLVDTVEALGDPRQVGARDADARVAHAHLHTLDGGRAVARPRAHGHPAALGCVLHRVVEEVDEDLRETVVVGVHAEVGRLDVRDEPDTAGLGLGPHDVEHRAEHVAEAHRPSPQRHLAELDVGEVGEVVEQPAEPLRVTEGDLEEPPRVARNSSCSSALRITSGSGLPSPRPGPTPNIARARSFMSTMPSCPSTAITPSTMPSRIAVALARSSCASSIFSRSRAIMTLSARPSAPSSSTERTGARALDSPSLIRRAISCISTMGRVTRPATKMPMPAATASASRPPASITRCSSAYEDVTTDSRSARRSTPTVRAPSRTGTAA